MTWFIDWCKSLTMEEMFIVTGVEVLLLGIGMALLIGWISEKENEEDDDD